MTPEPEKVVPEEIETESLVAGNPDSPNCLKGIVKITWGEKAGQLDIHSTRKLAIRLLEAAQAAETDQLYVQWLTTRLDMPLEAAVMVLRDIRGMREDWLR